MKKDLRMMIRLIALAGVSVALTSSCFAQEAPAVVIERAKAFLEKAEVRTVTEEARTKKRDRYWEIVFGSSLCILDEKSFAVLSWRALPRIPSSESPSISESAASTRATAWLKKMGVSASGQPEAVLSGPAWIVSWPLIVNGYPSIWSTSVSLDRASGEVWSLTNYGSTDDADYPRVVKTVEEAVEVVRQKYSGLLAGMRDVKFNFTQYVPNEGSTILGTASPGGRRPMRLAHEVGFVCKDGQGFAYVDAETGSILGDGIAMGSIIETNRAHSVNAASRPISTKKRIAPFRDDEGSQSGQSTALKPLLAGILFVAIALLAYGLVQRVRGRIR